MKKTLISILVIFLLLGLFATAASAAATGDAMPDMMMDMMKSQMMNEQMPNMPAMGQDMMDNDQCPMGYDECPLGQRGGMMHGNHYNMGQDMGHMGRGMMMPMRPGMMQHRMDHVFYLDRIDFLGLSDEQVTKLKAIRNECRRDNIRQAAEAQITRLDLMDLLNTPGWSLKQVEPLVRKSQQQESDMLLRHFKAVYDARQVLTDEQQKKVDAGVSGEVEDLFQ